MRIGRVEPQRDRVSALELGIAGRLGQEALAIGESDIDENLAAQIFHQSDRPLDADVTGLVERQVLGANADDDRPTGIDRGGKGADPG